MLVVYDTVGCWQVLCQSWTLVRTVLLIEILNVSEESSVNRFVINPLFEQMFMLVTLS